MKTVTFYSYKGGVGRTLLMVNLARYLMSRGKKLVLLDCDLEAPGLHYKFDYEKVTSKVSVGVVDFFHQFKRDETLPDMSEMLLEAQTHESGGSIHIVPAGDIQTVKYWERLSELDWRDMLYEGYGFHLFWNCGGVSRKSWSFSRTTCSSIRERVSLKSGAWSRRFCLTRWSAFLSTTGRTSREPAKSSAPFSVRQVIFPMRGVFKLFPSSLESPCYLKTTLLS